MAHTAHTAHTDTTTVVTCTLPLVSGVVAMGDCTLVVASDCSDGSIVDDEMLIIVESLQVDFTKALTCDIPEAYEINSFNGCTCFQFNICIKHTFDNLL